MEVVTMSSWDEFTQYTDQLEGWAFRGQMSAEWNLVSSLTRRLRRFCPDPLSWQRREERAMRIFRRKAHIYLRDSRVLDDDLRCLAMMQHHGAPTRLLDFTKSPFVAAFFALERTTSDAALFALNTPALWNMPPLFDASMLRERIDLRVRGNFDRYFAGNSNPILWFGEPAEMDRRLVAQSGLFVVPGQLHQSLSDILQHYDPAGSLLKKIVLPLRLRERAMNSLYRMNITHATLFPDMEGLARSIGYEMEVSWPVSDDAPFSSDRSSDAASDVRPDVTFDETADSDRRLSDS